MSQDNEKLFQVISSQ